LLTCIRRRPARRMTAKVRAQLLPLFPLSRLPEGGGGSGRTRVHALARSPRIRRGRPRPPASLPAPYKRGEGKCSAAAAAAAAAVVHVCARRTRGEKWRRRVRPRPTATRRTEQSKHGPRRVSKRGSGWPRPRRRWSGRTSARCRRLFPAQLEPLSLSLCSFFRRPQCAERTTHVTTTPPLPPPHPLSFSFPGGWHPSLRTHTYTVPRVVDRRQSARRRLRADAPARPLGPVIFHLF